MRQLNLAVTGLDLLRAAAEADAQMTGSSYHNPVEAAFPGGSWIEVWPHAHCAASFALKIL